MLFVRQAQAKQKAAGARPKPPKVQKAASVASELPERMLKSRSEDKRPSTGGGRVRYKPSSTRPYTCYIYVHVFSRLWFIHCSSCQFVYEQCKRKTSEHGPGPANNVLGRRQIVICSAQGPKSLSHIYADFSGLGLHNITWAGEELFLTSPGVW